MNVLAEAGATLPRIGAMVHPYILDVMKGGAAGPDEMLFIFWNGNDFIGEGAITQEFYDSVEFFVKLQKYWPRIAFLRSYDHERWGCQQKLGNMIVEAVT